MNKGSPKRLSGNPAALEAFARGDLHGYEVASQPGGVEAQEAAGQALFVASNTPSQVLARSAGQARSAGDSLRIRRRRSVRHRGSTSRLEEASARKSCDVQLPAR